MHRLRLLANLTQEQMDQLVAKLKAAKSRSVHRRQACELIGDLLRVGPSDRENIRLDSVEALLEMKKAPFFTGDATRSSLGSTQVLLKGQL